MKRLTIGLMTAFLALTFIPTQSNAGTETNQAPMITAKSVESAKANILVSRLEEIKAMDKSNLSAPEKQELRKEVRSIKEQLKELGGIYLSVGAIIIIILLLILLF